MNNILVLPEDLNNKLNEIENSSSNALTSWKSIEIFDANDMLTRIISVLNKNFQKLNIKEFKFEEKSKIKEKIGNSGANSMYAGYIESEEGVVKGTFFYIPPSLDSANDTLSRQVMPSLIGIYSEIESTTKDNHFLNRPVYIVNLNETKRMGQRSVKINIISALLMSFNYVDIYGNDYLDIIDEDIAKIGIDISQYNNLITNNGTQTNDWFQLDNQLKTITLLTTRLSSSENITAEAYRYLLRVIPAVYIAIKSGYKIEANDLYSIGSSTETIATLNKHVKKII